MSNGDALLALTCSQVVSRARWSLAFKLRAYADAIIDLRETLDNVRLPLCDE